MAYTFEQICDIIENLESRANRVYIGRTNRPERRLLQHHEKDGRNKLFVLRWLDTREQTKAFEKKLIKKYKARLENISPTAFGGWGPGRQAVYISWVWRGNPGDKTAADLTAVTVNAIPITPLKSRYLHTTLTPEHAGLQLALHDS